MCCIVPCIKVVLRAGLFVLFGFKNRMAAASGIRAMALAHDAASLNAIAASSTAKFRAWVHKKLGRSDVEVSCVCPLLFFTCL